MSLNTYDLIISRSIAKFIRRNHNFFSFFKGVCNIAAKLLLLANFIIQFISARLIGCANGS